MKAHTGTHVHHWILVPTFLAILGSANSISNLESSPSFQCSAAAATADDNETGTCKCTDIETILSKKVFVHNNGENDGVEMVLWPVQTAGIQAMIDNMAKNVGAKDTLEPHQAKTQQ